MTPTQVGERGVGADINGNEVWVNVQVSLLAVSLAPMEEYNYYALRCFICACQEKPHVRAQYIFLREDDIRKDIGLLMRVVSKNR